MIEVTFTDGTTASYADDWGVPLVHSRHHKPKGGYHPVAGDPDVFVKYFNRPASILAPGHELYQAGKVKQVRTAVHKPD